jgi:phosphoribosylglycinamide formyltransferase-1
LSDDTEETLAQRVLAREHVIYPMALAWLVRDALTIENGSVRVATGEAQWLL